MAIQVRAQGDAPATGMPKSVAPDEITNIRSPGVNGYGQNGSANNSSAVGPACRVVSPLGLNLEQSINDDGVLAQVIAKGTARVDSEITSQLRKIAVGNVPGHPFMSNPNASPATIPAKIGAASAPLPNPTK